MSNSLHHFHHFVDDRRHKRDEAIARFNRRQRRVMYAIYTAVAIMFVMGVMVH